jgi:predicted nucleotidyltransferase component of viral defense system
MKTTKTQDVLHKVWLYKILSAVYSDIYLAQNLYFKGGTCASMLGYLDRFSVDIDMDFVGKPEDMPIVRGRLEKIWMELGLEIKDQSKNTIQYFLKYPNVAENRNTIAIDAVFPIPKANIYEAKKFIDIDRTIICQSKETMFGNKLVAVLDRFKKHRAIAGRDIYDIHHFFSQNFSFNEVVIEERTGKKTKDFLNELIAFIEKNITETILVQDLNNLLDHEQLGRVRKSLKQDTLIFLRTYVNSL